MSVTVARAVVTGLRAWGVTTHESDGCYSRGNGQTSHYQGGIFHHTASNFGRDYKTLYDGRSDLPGPLCNTSGNDDGSITLIAAHPANHAGASGGWDTYPLPRTNLFNKEVWGHEIVYPGVVPMRDAQYRSATILARVLGSVLNRSMDYMKFHQGTSITGKWDCGYGNGKTYDIRTFRNAAMALTPGSLIEEEDEDMYVIGLSVADDPGQKRLLLVGAGRIPRGITKESQLALNKFGVKNVLMGLADYNSLEQEAIDERFLLSHQMDIASNS